MIIWCVIVLAPLFAIALNIILNIPGRPYGNGTHRLIEMGKERELFYCPGDAGEVEAEKEEEEFA